MKYIKLFEELNSEEIKSLEDYADYLFSGLGVNIVFSKHFKDRVNDARKDRPITYEELAELFRKAYHEAGGDIADLPDDTAAVLKDLTSKLNVPFKISEDPRHGETDAVMMTVMRKKNYLTNDQEILL